jgi:hypothetical protein
MSEGLYRRTGHVCRTCLGPILADEAGFVCAVCDASSPSDVSAICGCGIRISGTLQRGLGFRCAPNPTRSDGSPAAAVIMFGPSDEKLAGAAT